MTSAALWSILAPATQCAAGEACTRVESQEQCPAFGCALTSGPACFAGGRAHRVGKKDPKPYDCKPASSASTAASSSEAATHSPSLDSSSSSSPACTSACSQAGLQASRRSHKDRKWLRALTVFLTPSDTDSRSVQPVPTDLRQRHALHRGAVLTLSCFHCNTLGQLIRRPGTSIAKSFNYQVALSAFHRTRQQMS